MRVIAIANQKGGCGKRADEVGPISWTGLCGACGPKLHVQAVDELHYHRGPAFQSWRRGMATRGRASS